MKMTKTLQILNLLEFSLLIIYFNSVASFNYGDDVWATKQTMSWDTIIFLYHNWTARAVAFVFQMFMIHHPLIFRIMNSAIMIGMPIVTWLLIDRERKLRNLTIWVLLFLLYDYTEMRTTGIITTYITYYWSLFTNILFYIFIRRYLAAERRVNADLILAVIIGLIACNSEISSLANTMILAAWLLADYCKNRAANKKLVLMSLVPVLSLLFFLTCPGLRNRSAAETITWLPEFSSYTAVYKFYLGFAETWLYYFSEKPVILMFLLAALLVSVWKKVRGKRLSGAYIALVIFCACGFLMARDHSNLILKFSNLYRSRPYFFLLFLLCFCSFVLLILWRLLENNARIFLLAAFVLMLGLITRIVMGFSPTLYASSTRTFLYCDFALLVLIYLVMTHTDIHPGEITLLIISLLFYPYFTMNLLYKLP